MTNTTTNDASAPPSFELANVVDLVSVDDSKIINVSLYTGRAEITRLYKFPVKTGQNLVNINGLPIVMDQESLRCVYPSYTHACIKKAHACLHIEW